MFTKIYSNHKQNGFTLIELLVVIAIIGILAGFIIASFNTAQKKARDSQRKSDLDALKKALELAKGDSLGGAYYLSALTAANLEPDYILKIPTDPAQTNCGSGAGNYCYNVWGPVGGAGCVADQCTTYRLITRLENSKDPQRAGNVDGVGNPKEESTAKRCPVTEGSYTFPAYNALDYVVCPP